jgi:hypothetical protein
MTTISLAEFNKKVEVEFAHLSYVDRMPADAAKQQAIKNVSKEYQVG